MGVSLFPFVGNGQDSGTAAAPSSAATAYGTQGNAALNKTLHERELMQAAQEARQLKELKAAMAAQSSYAHPQTFLTAEQFLAANRPPMPPPSESPPVQRSSYVPEFQTGVVNNTADPSSAPNPVPTYSNPTPVEKKSAGLFDLFKGKKGGSSEYSQDTYAGPDVPPATYVNPQPETPPVERPAVNEEAMFESVRTPETGIDLPSREKPNLLGRLFSRTRETESAASLPREPAPVTEPVMEQTPVEADTTPSPSLASNDIPDVPSVEEEAPSPPPAMERPAPAPETRDSMAIFVKRNSSSNSGSGATVKADTKADVAGVNVTLFSGTRVTVLERSGTQAKVRLPDGRVGTVSVSSLAY